MSDQDAPDASPNERTITSQPDQQGPTATVQDWRELLAQRRLTAARQAYLVARRLRSVRASMLPYNLRWFRWKRKFFRPKAKKKAVAVRA